MARKRSEIFLMIAAVVIIAAGAAVHIFGPAATPVSAVPAGSSFSVATGTISESGQVSGQNYTVTADYPELSGTPQAAAFNAYVGTLVQGQVQDFKTAISRNDIAHLPTQMQSLANSFDIRYSIDGTSTDYVSATFSSDTYLLGMAHPSHLLTSLNMNLRDGSIINLADLFAPGADYLKTLSDITTADILKQIQSGQYDSTPDFVAQTGGTTANANNFQVFGLSSQGLVIHFQDYQVGPGASGPATVVIPYNELQSVAQPGGLLDQ